MMLYDRIVLLLVSGTLLISCNKEETEPAPEEKEVEFPLTWGLPASPEKVNGFLYASFTASGSASYGYNPAIVYADFRDPATNVLAAWNHYTDLRQSSGFPSGFVRVGPVSCGGVQLNESGDSYRGTGQGRINPAWHTQGNKSFVSLDLTVTHDYPDITFASSYVEVSTSSGWQVEVSKLAKNFDSVAVWLGSGSIPLLKKSASSSSATVISFSAKEIAAIKNQFYGYLTVFACNYSHIRRNKKVYVFELAVRKTYNVQFVD